MNQFKDTLRRAKIVLMAIGLIYGGSALSDLAVDEAGDVRELNSISRRDTINLHPSAYENSKEAIGKGLVSMLSFLLYSYSKTPNRFKYESSQKSVSYLITVIIPFNDKIALRESMTDELISLYFQNQETLFIRLINHALPPGTSDIIHINSLEIVKSLFRFYLGYNLLSSSTESESQRKASAVRVFLS